MALVCWECGSIIDIFERKGSSDTIFSRGCRECGNISGEKNTFLVKPDVKD